MEEEILNITKDFTPVDFSFDKIYTLNLYNEISVGNMNRRKCHKLLKDGRVLGLILEDLITDIFKNINFSDDGKILCNNTLSEIKVLTNHGSVLCKSYMTGFGRSFNQHEHISNVKETDYYIFVDNTSSPILKVIPIKTCDKLYANQISYYDFYKYFGIEWGKIYGKRDRK